MWRARGLLDVYAAERQDRPDDTVEVLQDVDTADAQDPIAFALHEAVALGVVGGIVVSPAVDFNDQPRVMAMARSPKPAAKAMPAAIQPPTPSKLRTTKRPEASAAAVM